MSGGILQTDGMSEATEAFGAVMDAETPTKSKKSKDDKREERMSMEDVFPSRRMNRDEGEGATDVPEQVKRARSEAGNRGFGEIDEDEPPRQRTPTEVTEPDDDEIDEEIEPEAEEPEDEEDARGPIDFEQMVEVQVDGQPVEVSLKEAIRGYIRTETFHQRLGELSKGVETLHGREREIMGYQQALVERAEALESYVTAFMPKEPDWDAIYQQDPAEGAKLERRWRTFIDQIQGLRTQRETTQRELADKQLRELHLFASAQRQKLAVAHPEWKNEKSWRRDHDSMRRTARTAGYTDQDIDQLYDARGFEILLKAAKYDRLMATKPKPVKDGYGTPAKRNGATPSRNVSKSFDRAEKRLSRTGSLNAAADVFERILDHEG